ncbi:hypothetical protein [Chitinophaga sp. S165]|uniref:hypothetical protein n=1 Tax=Chitinophaga sp. S165 TaxID=2135462 RepID=UPI000D71B784|nr:hypothetical protein [Chitinophaga sp. S165]PWV53787.1 hypothetical protein C7475_102537 [Chitinophaga sp. S165]
MKRTAFLLAAILINISFASAQEPTYAYNNTKVSTVADNDETPSPVTAFKLKVAQLDPEALVFKITVENPGIERVTLSIKDANNYTLHQESLPVTMLYVAKFNMQELQDGAYTFEIRRGRNRLAEKIVNIRTETSINRTVSVQ